MYILVPGAFWQMNNSINEAIIDVLMHLLALGAF